MEQSFSTVALCGSPKCSADDPEKVIFHDQRGSGGTFSSQAWETTTQLGWPKLVNLHVASALWWLRVVLQPILQSSLAIEVYIYSVHTADPEHSL